MRYRVTTPVAGYAGTVGSVTFADGAAEVDESAEAELGYFRARGYGVEEVVDATQPPKKSASADAWRAFTVAADLLSEDEASQMSRDELVAYYEENR
jgi:hypothetical protein